LPRPAHGASCARGLANGERRRRDLRGGEHRQHGGDRPRSRGAGVAGRARPRRPARFVRGARHDTGRLAGAGRMTEVLRSEALWYLVRASLGLRAWRMVHWLAYLAWPVALLHGVTMGTDAAALWSIIVAATCVLVVTASVAWRVQLARPRTERLA